MEYTQIFTTFRKLTQVRSHGALRASGRCSGHLGQVLGPTMVPPFDIFRLEENGKVLWIGTSSSVEEAERRIAIAISLLPTSYSIVSLKTGNQRVISPKQEQ